MKSRYRCAKWDQTLLSHLFGKLLKKNPQKTKKFTQYITMRCPSTLESWLEGVSDVGEEGVRVHNEPSDVMLLVICSETRGEILLCCHCSVKPHTAGQISLTRRILWKSGNSVLFPTGLRHGRGNRGRAHLLVRSSNSRPTLSLWHGAA